MTDEQLKKFQEFVKADPIFKEKLQAVINISDVLAISKEAGFCFSIGDIEQLKFEAVDALLREEGCGLSELELKAVRGWLDTLASGKSRYYKQSELRGNDTGFRPNWLF